MSGRSFWQGETHAIVKALKDSGNQVGLIAQYKASMEAWAKLNPGNADAAGVNAWLPLWQPRIAYTADELAPLWPALAIAVGHTRDWPSVEKSANRLANELHFAGLPARRIGDKTYFIVERLHHWKHVSADKFERELFDAQR